MGALAEFLVARRAQISPQQAGLPDSGRRRVPGLRREEVALLAGISVAYYVRLEQGHDRHPTQLVVDALADALLLDEDGHAHLRELAASDGHRVPPGALRTERVRPELARMLEQHIDAPALVLGSLQNVLACNRLATTLLPSFAPGRNVLRDSLLDPATRAAYPSLAQVQRTYVAALRAASVGRERDPAFAAFVGELTLASQAFASLWARHEVRRKRHGTKRFLHPAVGEIALDHDSFTVESAPHQRLVVFHADPASADGQSLALLRTLAADQPAGDEADDRKQPPCRNEHSG